MKILYIGVRPTNEPLKRSNDTDVRIMQIIKNDVKPAVELAQERDLTSFSRFTRGRWVVALYGLTSRRC
jgi:hypothetical protein